MQLQHEFTVPARLDESWAAFNHLELIASCFPGFTLTSVDGHDFEGALKVKLGTVPLDYSGTGRYLERHFGGRHTVMEATGSDKRGKGTATVKIRTSFSPAGDWTLVRVTSDVRFTGQQAQLDIAVVADAGDRLVARFATAVSARFAEGLGAEALRSDAGASYASDLGSAATPGTKTYTYNPPRPASQSDYEVIRAAAPAWGRRLSPPLLGGLAVLFLARQVRRRREARSTLRVDDPQPDGLRQPFELVE